MGHDNNRDSYMMNGIDSRVRQRVWREWEPDIIYVHHQSSPFPTRIWIPPFADPVGLRAPAIPAREINTIGTFIAQELDAHEQPGATHMLATYDAYYPGYIDYMPVYQNIPSWWTETQGGGCATTRTTTQADLPKDYQDTRPTPLYLSPWLEGKWSLRDAVNYMVTASIATLRYAAKFKEDVIYNRYQSGRDVIQKYSTKGPYAYIIPQDQRDPVAPVELLRRFAFHGLRISQLDKDASYNGTTYHKGDWVIPMNQEFASLVQEIFEVQHYPADADDNPYDAAGWTLPFQMGVNVIEATTPLSAGLPRRAQAGAAGQSGRLAHRARRAAHDERERGRHRAARGRIHRHGRSVLDRSRAEQRVQAPVRARSTRAASVAFSIVAGRTQSLRLVRRRAGDGRRLGEGALGHRRAHVRCERRTSVSGSPPRIGLANEGMNWTQWLFDTFGIKYTMLTPADLSAGNLASRFDVLVLVERRRWRRSWRRRWWRRRTWRAAAVAAARRAERTMRRTPSINSCAAAAPCSRGATAPSSTAQALQLPVQSTTAGLSAKGILHRHVGDADPGRRSRIR